MAKKVVDKWKSKRWFTVVAPDVFDRRNVAEIVSSDESNLIGRTVSASLDVITGNYAFPNPYVMVKFKITDVKGQNCFTKYVGHELAFSYISTLVRRRKSLIDHVTINSTLDNIKLKIKTLMVAPTKISRRARRDLRHKVDEFFVQKLKESSLSDFLKLVFFSKLNAELYSVLKKIAPIARVEIKKVELAKVPKKDEKQKQQTKPTEQKVHEQSQSQQ